MTREEAIKILKSKMDGSVDTSYEWAETVRMAIEALNCSEIPNGSTLKNLTKPNKNCEVDLISRQDTLAEFIDDRDVFDIMESIESLPSVEPLVLTCDGCRHVGTYDTDFPCSGCIRREKDYYEQER